MPIFQDKTNERIAIIFATIILIILICVSQCNKSDVEFGNIKITPQNYIQEKKELVQERANEFRAQLDSLDKILDKELPRILKDSIATMNYIRQKDLNQAEELLKTFNQFNKLTGQEQEDFLRRLYDFLSKKNHPNRYIDFGIVAKEIMTINKIGILIVEKENKDKEIEDLKKQIAKVAKDKQKIEELYIEAQKLIKQNNKIIEFLRSDSTHSAGLIESLHLQNTTLEKEKEKLKTEMDSYTLIRINNCSFTSPGCRSKKDGSYVVGGMKSLELKFLYNYNNPFSKDKNETLRVVFMIHPDGSSENKVLREKTIVAKVGEETKVSFDESNYHFVNGFYTAQIFDDKVSKTIPLDIKNLTAKKWLTK